MIRTKKIKVAYMRTQFWFGLRSGGSVGHTAGVLNGFRKNGAEIKILSNEKFYGIDKYRSYIIEPRLKKPPWFGELLYNFRAKKIFRKKLLENIPDIIYHRYTGYTFFAASLARSLGIPLILEFNSFDSWKLLNWEKSRNPVKRILQRTLLYWIVKKIELYNLDAASLVTTVSEPLKDDLISIGIESKKIFVNPNGYDSNRFKPEVSDSKESGRIREKLGKNKTTIGFCGTFGPWHGIPQLTEAIYKIFDYNRLEDITFLIIGDGGKLKDRMMERLSGYDRVVFTGNIDYSKIHYYLGACDILVSPHNPPVDSREFFGSPTKIFEYMGTGKAIIASDLGQIGKILKDGKTAILTKPGDVDKLVDGIVELANNPGLRGKLGKNASRTAINGYTWNKNIERLVEEMKKKNII